MEHQGADRRGNRPRIGERLAAAREAQGIALADISARTRVPLRALTAIEAGTNEGLPALTYSAGFVRSYAQALGLDGAECAAQYRAESGRAPQPYVPAELQLADPARIPSRLLAIVALVVAVLIAGAYALWRGDGLFGGGAAERARLAAGTESARPSPAAPAAPRVAPIVRPLAPPAGPVVLTATAPVWLKVYERTGKTLYLGTMAPGARFAVPADAVDPLIRTGRAQAIVVTVGGVAVPTLGPPDVLVKDRSLARSALIGPPALGAPLVAQAPDPAQRAGAPGNVAAPTP